MDRRNTSEAFDEANNFVQKTKRENSEIHSFNKSVSINKQNMNKSSNKVNNNEDGLLILNELDLDFLEEKFYTYDTYSDEEEEEEKVETLEKERNDRDNHIKILDMEATPSYRVEKSEERKVDTQILKFSQFSAEIKKQPSLEIIPENKEILRKTTTVSRNIHKRANFKSERQLSDRDMKDIVDSNNQPIKSASNRLKEIFKDYGNKLGANGKTEAKHLKSTSNAVNNQQRSTEDENKLNSLNLIKNTLFKQLKLKRKENEIRITEQSYQLNMKKKKETQPILNEFRNSQRDLYKNQNNNLMDFRSSIIPFTSVKNKKKENEKKLNKNQLMKKRKRLLRYLKIKKYKKQIKKKQKQTGNFLKIQNYIDNKNFIYSNAQFNEWKQFLEDQIKNIFSQKNLNINYMTKTLINNFEITPFLETGKVEKINSNLNKLILFNDEIYKDIEKPRDSSIRNTQILNFKPENTPIDLGVNSNSEPFNKFKENQNISNEEEDSQIMLQRKKEAEKEKLLIQLKKKLEDLKNRNEFIEEAKKIIVGEDSNKNKNLHASQASTLKPKPTLEGAPGNIRSTMFTKFGQNGIFIPEEKLAKLTPKLDPNDKMKVKQRILNHSMKIYEKFDLKKIIIFWRNNMKKEEFVNRKKTSMGGKSKKDEEEAKKLKESNSQQKNKVDEKKNGNNIVHIKQNFAQPNDNVKKLIPFFNNVYTIQKNES
jgi:hypothetical protein